MDKKKLKGCIFVYEDGTHEYCPVKQKPPKQNSLYTLIMMNIKSRLRKGRAILLPEHVDL